MLSFCHEEVVFIRTVHIVNPTAGKGQSMSFLKLKSESDIIYESVCRGDIERYTRETLTQNPHTHLYVYGGDGSINEAVNGIMASGAGDEALLTPVPTGSGNDFIKTLGEFDLYGQSTQSRKIDLIKYNGRYAINILNIGFDCTVVEKVEKYKHIPLISGSFAYILGVADVLAHLSGESLHIVLSCADGTEEIFSGEFLLCAAANGQYYGGGFRSAPLALCDDGLLDVMVIKKISRKRFISLVGDYKKGGHMNFSTGAPSDKFADIISFKKCTKLTITQMKKLCADGDIEAMESAEVSVVPQAVNIAQK